MKLVDILAREFKVWPEGMTDKVGQCFDGRIHGYAAAGHPSCQVTVSHYPLCDSYATDTATRAEWQAAVDALNAPKVVEWDGAGMPPIGRATCEYLGAHQYNEWTVVNIFAHYGHTVFVDFGDGWRAEKDDSRFRPLSTAERLAAEERERDDNEVMRRYLNLSDYEKGMLGHSPQRIIIGLMRVMGYRKEPKPCGS